MIERILDIHKRFFHNIIISTNSPDIYFRYGLVMIGDVLNERGPMTGILSSMISSDDDWFFVTACDMPFLSEKLIEYILSVPQEAHAIVPLYDGNPQPLLGLYNRRLIERLYVNITAGKKRMITFLNEIHAYFIEEEKVRAIDPEGKSFMNINTLTELENI